MKLKNSHRKRFDFIDQFRGFVGILMLLGHSSYYFNNIWLQLDPLEPVFPDWAQFALRYAGYLCAPGFLMMAGAMVWWSYHRRVDKGGSPGKARWHLIQRGLFLIIVQMTWVNSSWGGFATFRPWHLGIIATIGISMILLTLVINTPWFVRLLLALALWSIHPFLLAIPYSTDNQLAVVVMQTFVDSGDFNKYPVIPWFGMALMGSVMANGWLRSWKLNRQRILYGLGIAFLAIGLATLVRLGRGFGNLEPFTSFGSISFLIDQKYPPSLFMNLWFFGAVVFFVSIFATLNRIVPWLVGFFAIPGKVPLFFYAVHLAVLGIFSKRLNIYYREGEVLESLIGMVVMTLIMLPLCIWFYGVKRKSKNYFIQMI